MADRSRAEETTVLRLIEDAARRGTTHLELSYQEISELPNEIGHVVSLQSLDLRMSGLESLPESIGHLVNLKSLYLGGNQLKSLPESIGQLTNLQSVTLTEVAPEI